MKPIIPVVALISVLTGSPAVAFDTADVDTVTNFVETTYPRITSLSPMQEEEALATRLRHFATEDNFRQFSATRKEDGTLDFVFRDGGMVVNNIVSKVSVTEKGKGEWQAEFIARHKRIGSDSEDTKCLAVKVSLRELALAPGTTPLGIENITSKPSTVKCPAD
jgi:hypothetical protein